LPLYRLHATIIHNMPSKNKLDFYKKIALLITISTGIFLVAIVGVSFITGNGSSTLDSVNKIFNNKNTNNDNNITTRTSPTPNPIKVDYSNSKVVTDFKKLTDVPPIRVSKEYEILNNNNNAVLMTKTDSAGKKYFLQVDVSRNTESLSLKNYAHRYLTQKKVTANNTIFLKFGNRFAVQSVALAEKVNRLVLYTFVADENAIHILTLAKDMEGPDKLQTDLDKLKNETELVFSDYVYGTIPVQVGEEIDSYAIDAMNQKDYDEAQNKK
jgi:hypothetical protein